MKKIGFIGAGNMGGALAQAVSKKSECAVMLTDKEMAKAAALAEKIGAEAVSLDKICKECDYIFLGVKPNVISSVIKDIGKPEGAVIVSMAAGVSTKKIEEAFGCDVPVIRIMPNTPASVGEGMILVCSNSLSGKYTDEFMGIMSEAGTLDIIDEKLIDAASAISGCGPAFVYMYIEALADGGVECGLPRDKAMLYAAKTLVGAARLVLETGEHPGKLKDAVCSPGGSTIAGVHALERGKLRSAASDAVVAAYEKTLKLGK